MHLRALSSGDGRIALAKMFTGIIEEVGMIAALERGEESARITLSAPALAGGISVGDSVAINGVCLTVVNRDRNDLAFDAVPETIRRSNFKRAQPGDPVNLERSLRVGDRLCGHFVQGHVDGEGALTEVRQDANARVLRVAPPAELMRFIAPKGSIALDGISLTVADVDRDSFAVWIVPYTWENTNLRARKTGDSLNIEVDMLARYIDRLLATTAGIQDDRMENEA